MAAFCIGNLFGIIIPFLGFIFGLIHILLRPIMNTILYSGAYAAIILENKFLWFGFLCLWNMAVAFTDNSHRDVEGADYRTSRSCGFLEKAAEDFWESAYDYIQMTVIPWDEEGKLNNSNTGKDGTSSHENSSSKESNATLPPNRQYIFAVHPHGIHCIPLGLFHRQGTAFDKRFPGICGNKLSGLVATVIFKVPCVREIFLSLPYIDASRHIAEAALKANRSLFVCTGSGEESLLTRHGSDVLVLSKRKGFIRLALAYGCDIVPIFGIGNSDLFVTYSWGSGFRMWLQKRLHISIPIFHGRYFSPLPYRVHIRVLVGEPLKVPEPKVRGEAPDEALVEEYLKKYIEKVKELHKKHATNRKLQII